MRRYVLVLLTGVLVAGCATTTPKFSHVHVGHAITGWVDTPDKRGLFVTAEREAMVIAEQAKLAVESADLSGIREHARGVMHAVDPSTQSSGPGLGFGFRRAITEANNHIEYAATSPDTSPNIEAGAEAYHENQAVVVERGELIFALAESIQNSESLEEARTLAKEMHEMATRNLKGVDKDGDGVIGSTPEEYGLRQLRSDLVAVTEREDPPYRAVSQKYLFGLVRLPDGTWEFKEEEFDSAYAY